MDFSLLDSLVLLFEFNRRRSGTMITSPSRMNSVFWIDPPRSTSRKLKRKSRSWPVRGSVRRICTRLVAANRSMPPASEIACSTLRPGSTSNAPGLSTWPIT